jgi:DNA-binding NarL/FixJ family response regulator
MNYISTEPFRAPAARRGWQERMRTVVLITPDGVLPAAFKQAAEYAFPWAVMEEVHNVDQAVRIFPNTVPLILIHRSFLEEAKKSAADLFRFHPMAIMAVLDDGCGPDEEGLSPLLDSSFVRGVLPIQARREVCLAILGLLLQGVEYFPRSMLTAALKRREAEPAPVLVEESQEISGRLKVLTKRELQVLELVQQGLQNKSIANDLHLSGHTVKIHLHNIISKLGARNRTEAAAIYRDATVGPSQGQYARSADPASSGAGRQTWSALQ